MKNITADLLVKVSHVGFYKTTSNILVTKEIKQSLESINKENASKLWKMTFDNEALLSVNLIFLFFSSIIFPFNL